MKRNLLFLVILTVALGLMAQPAMKGGPHGKWWTNPEVQQKLNLTPDQISRLDKVFLSHMEKMIDLKAGVEKNKLYLDDLMGQETLNEKDALSQVDRLLQARNTLERERASMLIKMRMILTPDQWKQAQALKQQVRQGIKKRMKERMERHSHGEHHGRRGGQEMGGSPEGGMGGPEFQF